MPSRKRSPMKKNGTCKHCGHRMKGGMLEKFLGYFYDKKPTNNASDNDVAASGNAATTAPAAAATTAPAPAAATTAPAATTTTATGVKEKTTLFGTWGGKSKKSKNSKNSKSKKSKK